MTEIKERSALLHWICGLDQIKHIGFVKVIHHSLSIEIALHAIVSPATSYHFDFTESMKWSKFMEVLDGLVAQMLVH